MTLNYILETTVCWLFFYLLYALWLRKETFFTANRTYLIGTLLLGLLIPAIDFMPTPQPVIIQDVTIYLNEITITTEANSKPDATFQISEIPRLIYWTGLAVCLLRFLLGIGGILRLFIGSEILRKTNYTLVRTVREHAPFSFLNFFFVSKKMNFSEAEWQQVTQHEEAHIRGVHTLDVLLVEALAIVFWFNPLIYLYKHAVRDVHEYLADAAVVKTVPTVHYGRFLVSIALPGFRMANNFNHSQLKKRIIMMTKSQSSKIALAKYILFIPLALLMFFVFSCKDDVQNLTTKSVSDKHQVSLVYNENLEFVNEFSNLGKTEAEIAANPFSLDVSEERITASLEAFEQEMKNEYAQLTTPEAKQAFKDEFIQELSQRTGIKNLMVAFTDDVVEEETSKNNNADPPRPPIHSLKVLGDDGTPIKEVQIEMKSPEIQPNKNTLYTTVDEMPRFPDCENIAGTSEERQKCAEQKMLQYIYTNITYPAEARDAGIEGMVIVSFIVETDGRITNAEIIRSLGYETDEVVLGIVESMPNWTPGMHEGEAVRVKFNLPIRFKLEG